MAAASTLAEPPAFLDLAWGRTDDGRWVARLTPLAEVAFERCRKGPKEAGITVRGRTVEWDLSQAPREPKLSIRLRAWERQAQEEIAVRAEREAARRPVDASALSAIQADLAALLACAGWAFRAKEAIARGFAQASALTPGQHRFAQALYNEARDVVAAVDRRLVEPAGQEALALAEGREADLLEACRVLTGMDGDRARDANSMGWDAVASPAGHQLAAREFLTRVEAGHAWALVYRHRRQLPVEMRDRLGIEA